MVVVKTLAPECNGVLFLKWSRGLGFCFWSLRSCALLLEPAVWAVEDVFPLRIIPAKKYLQIRMNFSAENHPCAEFSSNQDAFPR